MPASAAPRMSVEADNRAAKIHEAAFEQFSLISSSTGSDDLLGYYSSDSRESLVDEIDVYGGRYSRKELLLLPKRRFESPWIYPWG